MPQIAALPGWHWSEHPGAWDALGVEVTRVDRWLWAVRVTPTRVASTQLCRAGHVRVNGVAAKPSTTVHLGDTVSARVGQRDRIFEVVRIIDKRAAASVAAACAIDHSPPAPARGVTPAVLRRDPSTGRPTKKERREIDRLRGR